MSVIDKLTKWWTGEPSIADQKMADVHRNMRKAVHESRNMATIALAEARLAEKSSNRICQVAQQVIDRLETVRRETER